MIQQVGRESRTLLMLKLHPSEGTKVEEVSETGSSPSRHTHSLIFGKTISTILESHSGHLTRTDQSLSLLMFSLFYKKAFHLCADWSSLAQLLWPLPRLMAGAQHYSTGHHKHNLHCHRGKSGVSPVQSHWYPGEGSYFDLEMLEMPES